MRRLARRLHEAARRRARSGGRHRDAALVQQRGDAEADRAEPDHDDVVVRVGRARPRMFEMRVDSTVRDEAVEHAERGRPEERQHDREELQRGELARDESRPPKNATTAS